MDSAVYHLTIYAYLEKTDRQTDRQTIHKDKKTDRQTDRQTTRTKSWEDAASKDSNRLSFDHMVLRDFAEE